MIDRPLQFRPRLRVDDFVLLGAAGALTGATKTELLDGDLVCMNAQFRRHAYAKNELTFRLRIALRNIASNLAALSEVSVVMSSYDMPEPDIVLTGEPLGDGPIPVESVALLIEVADSTLEQDLGRKALLYAASGVPEYWVVDLAGRVIARHWRPAPDGYQASDVVAFGDPLLAITISGLEVETAAID